MEMIPNEVIFQLSPDFRETRRWFFDTCSSCQCEELRFFLFQSWRSGKQVSEQAMWPSGLPWDGKCLPQLFGNWFHGACGGPSSQTYCSPGFLFKLTWMRTCLAFYSAQMPLFLKAYRAWQLCSQFCNIPEWTH
jgi:hypothetical protein